MTSLYATDHTRENVLLELGFGYCPGEEHPPVTPGVVVTVKKSARSPVDPRAATCPMTAGAF